MKRVAHLEIYLSTGRIEGVAVPSILLPHTVGGHGGVATA